MSRVTEQVGVDSEVAGEGVLGHAGRGEDHLGVRRREEVGALPVKALVMRAGDRGDGR